MQHHALADHRPQVRVPGRVREQLPCAAEELGGLVLPPTLNGEIAEHHVAHGTVGRGLDGRNERQRLGQVRRAGERVDTADQPLRALVAVGADAARDDQRLGGIRPGADGGAAPAVPVEAVCQVRVGGGGGGHQVGERGPLVVDQFGGAGVEVAPAGGADVVGDGGAGHRIREDEGDRAALFAPAQHSGGVCGVERRGRVRQPGQCRRLGQGAFRAEDGRRLHEGPGLGGAAVQRAAHGTRSFLRGREPGLPVLPLVAGDLVEQLQNRTGGAVGVLEQPPRGPRRQVHPDAGEGELGDVLRPERSHVHGDGTVMVEHLPGAVRDRVRQRVHDHQQDEQLPAVRPADGRRQGLQGLGIGPVGVVDDEDGGIVHQGQQLVRHLHRITSGGGGLQQLLDGAPRAPRLPRDTRGRAHLPVVEQLGESLHQSGLADTRRTLDEGEHG